MSQVVMLSPINAPKFFKGSGTTVGAVTANLVTLPLGTVPGTYTYEAHVAAFEAGTPSGAGYRITGSVRTTGAAAVLIPSQVVDEFEENALVACTAELAVAANTAIIRVTGVIGLTINWRVVGYYIFAS